MTLPSPHSSVKFAIFWSGLMLVGIMSGTGCGSPDAPGSANGNTGNAAALTNPSNAKAPPTPPSQDAKDGSKNSKPPSSEILAGTTKKRTPVKTAAKPTPDINDARFHAQLQTAADEYLRYAMVNTTPSVAPELCDVPPPSARYSAADDPSAHAKKLYFLFAKDIAHYYNRDGSPSPVGQALVKEAWTAVPGNPDARNSRNHASAIRINPRVKVGDKTLKLGKRTDLFLMLKLKFDTPGTAEGWVYGVVDAESNKVKAAGKVASCLACHQQQEDQLFRSDIADWSERVVAESPSTDEPKLKSNDSDSDNSDANKSDSDEKESEKEDSDTSESDESNR